MKNLTKERRCPSPGVTREWDYNLAPGETSIPLIIDHTFNRNGRKWRVTVVADTFVIGTAIDAQRDSNGEVSRETDIIRVML